MECPECHVEMDLVKFQPYQNFKAEDGIGTKAWRCLNQNCSRYYPYVTAA